MDFVRVGENPLQLVPVREVVMGQEELGIRAVEHDHRDRSALLRTGEQGIQLGCHRRVDDIDRRVVERHTPQGRRVLRQGETSRRVHDCDVKATVADNILGAPISWI